MDYHQLNQLKRKPNTSMDTFMYLLEEKRGSIFLNEKSDDLLRQIKLDFEHKEKLASRNIPLRNKIFLKGSPGNGKTTLARFIGDTLGLPTYIMKTESLVNSHLGESMRNVGSIFEHINFIGKCVVFFDEIDSFCAKRQQSNEGGATQENDRIVNQFLVGMDGISDETIFIGASNLPDKIDPAIMRRFDFQHEMNDPTDEEKKQFSLHIFRRFKTTKKEFEKYKLDMSYCKSFHDVERYITNLVRTEIFNQG